MHRSARQLPVQHLSVRLPWHDTGWTGAVCKAPSKNSWCMVLKRIREERQDAAEEAMAGRTWSEVGETELPACLTERGAALNAKAYSLRSRHPFADSSAETHGHFAENEFRLPPYSLQTIPFRWTRKEDAQAIADELALPFDLAREPQLAFETVWVNDFVNQQIMLDTFFSALAPEKSLVFLYAKRTPLTDDPRRVLVGVGRIISVMPAQEHAYNDDAAGKLRGLMWERAVSHSIRPDGFNGFILPYQELLALAERDGTIDPSEFVAFAPDEGFEAFSNVAEHVNHDLAIASLLSLADKVRVIAKHISGAWDRHLEWISERLSELWQLRGAFPGLGSALHAFEIRYGTLLAMDLAQRYCVDGRWEEDPWALVSRALEDPTRVLSPQVVSQVQPFDGKRLSALPGERLELLKLLSRFNLTIEQASRFFNTQSRENLTDKEILHNPYRLFETDRHRLEAVTIGTIDRGMFPDNSVREAFPLPEISRLEGDQDPRRIRALAVHVLANAETSGHTLLPVDQVLQGICELELDPPCRPSKDLLPLLDPTMAPEIVDASLSDGMRAWQFGQRRRINDLLRQQVIRRRQGRRHEVTYAWRELVDQSLGAMPEDHNERAVEELARTEKAAALAELYSARFSLLLGPAGTGKTRLLQMLCDLPEVRGDGILLLAPTGKARVQMQRNIEGLKALTIAQFLLPDRFNPETQQYQLSSAPKVESAGTVIIDEASMVTEDMLAAVFDALKGPKRIILVGDHRQLPPIGAGRPLVDLARELRPWDEQREPPFPRVGPGYTELTVHRRQTGKGKAGRDDLLLASWFTDEAPDPGADEIWARMALGQTDGHVEVRCWQTDEELKNQLVEVLVQHVPEIQGPNDERGFGISLGGEGTDQGVFFNATWAERNRIGSASRCENWQLLTPVRSKGHGVEELNRFLHERFRKQALGFAAGRRPRTPRPNGAERIIYGDKVISTTNKKRGVLGGRKELVSNGEIGVVVGQTKFGKAWDGKTPERLDVEFRTQPGNTFVYWPGDFGDDGTVVLELAYALTVHKSQGSQFGRVFVVIPQPCFILGRELIYTALTRQVDRVVLFVQGQPSDIRAYTSSKYSEVARRFTNLFAAPDMLADPSGTFLERRLIHRTARGELVRSISEVVVADALHAEGIDYHYEKGLRGADGVERYPDFTAEDPATGVTVYWEHLGMLSDPTYANRWKKKLEWYKDVMDLEPDGPENKKGERLVTSENRLDGAIDSAKIRQQVREVFDL
ncbi:ATP-dependent exoDNAse (exonuclease V) alpha subunit [Paracoccus pantotrophus]|uniref:AAA family ATPase n=3 Tax=Paracoccus TaxID=265 RepID=A0AAE6NVQ4_PARPN|nr:AAA family ATPase [Paracoccus pantotrophus]RKS52270.1 ATP-dependent exoDNAse (exonuclease V) alpha subunit [Paracoccus pantotrophus]